MKEESPNLSGGNSKAALLRLRVIDESWWQEHPIQFSSYCLRLHTGGYDDTQITSVNSLHYTLHYLKSKLVKSIATQDCKSTLLLRYSVYYR